MLKKSLLSAGLAGGAQGQAPKEGALAPDAYAFPCIKEEEQSNAPATIDMVTKGMDKMQIRSLPGSAPTAIHRPGSLVVSAGHWREAAGGWAGQLGQRVRPAGLP